MSIQTPTPIAEMIDKLRALLAAPSRQGVQLGIADDGYVEEGGWVYLIVTPSSPGIRAHEYVHRLGEIEQELRKEVGQQVLVVPAAPD
ncbi:MAG: hypothetical protein IID40_00970 [Planctomycetes bacterium]|nr:hypothetical protein [Planctomycetota bacterium]